jgi:hypothetical protein
MQKRLKGYNICLFSLVLREKNPNFIQADGRIMPLFAWIMKLLLTIVAAALLLFNGIGALYGGWSLMAYPDGSNLQMPLEWLERTPFSDFLIPGIILFIAMLLFNHKKASWLVMAQGVILMGWIVVQILLVQKYHPLQLILGVAGIGLIAAGYLRQKYDRE